MIAAYDGKVLEATLTRDKGHDHAEGGEINEGDIHSLERSPQAVALRVQM